MSDRPLIALALLFKNEVMSAPTLVGTCAPHVDAVVLLDTGSTDGTQEAVRAGAEAAGKPFHLFEEPFVDFSTSRNRLLDLAAQATGTEFILMLSGDEILVDAGNDLRSFCEARRGRTSPHEGAYYVTVSTGDAAFPSARLTRADLGAAWRYRGPVHEVMTGPGGLVPIAKVPGAKIIHGIFDQDRARHFARKRRRMYDDIRLLREASQADPKDTRSQFYLGKTLQWLGFHAEAIEALRRRVESGGWVEEVYEASFAIAECTAALGRPWGEVQTLYLEAHDRDPRRAEPLVAIARHHLSQGSYALAWLFASRAASMPYPEACVLFVNPAVYRWEAAEIAGVAGFHVGEFEAGERFSLAASAARPDLPYLQIHAARYATRRDQLTVNKSSSPPEPDLYEGPREIKIKCRPGTNDLAIMREVIDADVYRLGEDPLPAGAVVVDVGAHIGAFTSWASSQEPAPDCVIAAEVDDDNFTWLARNVGSRRGVRATRVALVGGVRPAGYVRVDGNTGGTRVAWDRSVEGLRELPRAMTLGQFLESHEDILTNRRIDFLKLDCEGSEHAILRQAADDKTLDRIDRIVGEYHDFYGDTVADLASLLEENGFGVETTVICEHSGMFFARRKPSPSSEYPAPVTSTAWTSLAEDAPSDDKA